MPVRSVLKKPERVCFYREAYVVCGLAQLLDQPAKSRG